MTLRRYRTSLATAAVLVFSTNIANYAERFGLYPVYWIAGFLLATAPLALVAAWSRPLRPNPIIAWSVAYLLISWAWFFLSTQSGAAWQQVQTRVLSVLFLVLTLMLFADRSTHRPVRLALVAATLLTGGLNLYELFHPMTFSDIPGRSTGLFANVNQSGAALVLGVILGQGVVPPRLRFGYVLATGLGVLPTFSRAAILGWLLVGALTWLQAGVHFRRVVGFGATAAAAAGFLFSPAWASIQRSLAQRGVLTENVLDRLAFFERGAADDASTEARLGVARLAWSTFADHPFFGTGTGASTEGIFELGPHNMYLALMADHGILGLLIFPAFILATIWGINRRTAPVALPFAAFIALWGLFSHNILEERFVLLAFALVAAIVATGRSSPIRHPEVPS